VGVGVVLFEFCDELSGAVVGVGVGVVLVAGDEGGVGAEGCGGGVASFVGAGGAVGAVGAEGVGESSAKTIAG